MKEYSELRRLAEAATKCYGAMRVEKDYNGVYQVVGAGSWNILSAWHTPDGKSKDNAEFHAAASPAAVLELIAEVDRLSFREEMLSEYGCEYCAGSGHVHRIDGDYLGVCDSCSAYEFNCAKHEIEKLKNENESLKKDAARYRWLRQYDFDIGSYHPEGDFSHESWFERFDDQSIDRMIAEEIAFEEEAIIEANNK